jgi:protein associated with RNAse G/E
MLYQLTYIHIVSTAECECGDGLQTEEYIFWDFKLYEDQRATMIDISSENSKKEYPKSVTELLRLEEKRICSRRLLLQKQNS